MALLRNYTLIHRSPTGTFKHLIGDAYSVKWVLKLNKAGTLVVELPSAFCSSVVAGYNLDEFDSDDQFILYRTYGAGFSEVVGSAPFHLQKLEARRKEDGKKTIYVEAATPLSFLERRIHPYHADRNRSDLDNNALAADDLVKEIVRWNYDPTAESYLFPANTPDPDRNLSAYLTIAANTTSIVPAPPYTASIENVNILSEVQKIADYAASKGIPMFFDVVMTSETPYQLQFRTFANQRGLDRTQATGGANAFTVIENINVADYTLTYDWTDTLNRVYAGSSGGEGGARTYQTATDPNFAAMVAISPFALREDFVSSSSDDTTAILVDAETELQARRAVFQASGLLAENFVQLYGRDFAFGDRVSIYLEGQTFDAFIDSESGTLADNRSERLEIGFNTEATLRRSSGGIGTIIGELGYQRRVINHLKRREVP